MTTLRKERTRCFSLHEVQANPELERLLRESVEAVCRMTPEQREAMLKAQRESWARQDMD